MLNASIEIKDFFIIERNFILNISRKKKFLTRLVVYSRFPEKKKEPQTALRFDALSVRFS